MPVEAEYIDGYVHGHFTALTGLVVQRSASQSIPCGETPTLVFNDRAVRVFASDDGLRLLYMDGGLSDVQTETTNILATVRDLEAHGWTVPYARPREGGWPWRLREVA